jgi:predicted amidophosphoribosyltransferase
MKANNQTVFKQRGRIDYDFFNYCAECGMKVAKVIMRCPDCRQKVRTRPWHRSKIVDMKRI